MSRGLRRDTCEERERTGDNRKVLHGQLHFCVAGPDVQRITKMAGDRFAVMSPKFQSVS